MSTVPDGTSLRSPRLKDGPAAMSTLPTSRGLKLPERPRRLNMLAKLIPGVPTSAVSASKA